ncbi:MAG TPA: hypothetical protein VJN01_12635, partial [Xanthomonadales bacterium]|nr:hypothetical protein [Xanthomonadales bacterium]
MRTIILGLLLCWPWLELQAFTNFVENPYTPYPLACDWTYEWSNYAWYDSDGDSRRYKFHEGEVTLKSPGYQGRPVTAVVRAYRISCPEANRSQILLQFTSPGDKDAFYATPSIRAILDDNKTVLMSLSQAQGSWNLAEWPAAQPGNFGMTNCMGNNGFCSQVGWSFVLDNQSPLIPGVEASQFITAEEYNDSFRLELNFGDSSAGYVIDVPATTAEFHESANVPLSGRHSGLWVIDATSDQGFNIAVSEFADRGNGWVYESPYVPPLLLFLSWYTFDAAGQPMWLTGAAEFQYGASEVAFSLISVRGGEFLGDQKAQRQVVGQVKITAHNCNNLGFEY